MLNSSILVEVIHFNRKPRLLKKIRNFSSAVITTYVLWLLFTSSSIAVIAQENSITLSAEVLLKPESGRSLSQSNVPITTENIKTFTPSAATLAEAKRRFESLGFSVPIANTTLTIMGKPIQFEEAFKIKLNLQFNHSSGSIVAYLSREPIISDFLKDNEYH